VFPVNPGGIERSGDMRYLCLLYVAEGAGAMPGEPGWDAVVVENVAVREAMSRAGVLVECAPLQPVGSATTLRERDGELLLTDGPYAELKEQLGGFYLIECADLDEALRWARMIPATRIGTVEVRPLIDTRATR
jgi:hypothetical protein